MALKAEGLGFPGLPSVSVKGICWSTTGHKGTDLITECQVTNLSSY